ncbi:MAG: hypothetical protein ACHQNT_09235 [Bacteroidia bacterium]
MTTKKDVFNSGNAEYDTFVNGLYNQVNTNHVAWGIAPAIVAAILALLTPWNTLWAISKNKTTSNSADRENTRLAREALTAYLRPFVQVSIYRNTSMTDADIITCGLEPRDKTKSPVGKPVTEPDMDYKVTGTHQVSAFYRQAPGEDGVSHRGKPENVGSVKVAYFVGENPPLNPDDFSKTVTGTRSPVKITFDPAVAGKKVIFAASWVSTSNIQGEWGEVQTMVVP